MALWRDLGISSWPTLVVVSPRGRVLATLPGQATPPASHARTHTVPADKHIWSAQAHASTARSLQPTCMHAKDTVPLKTSGIVPGAFLRLSASLQAS